MRALVEEVKAGYTIYHAGDVWLVVEAKEVKDNVCFTVSTGVKIVLPVGTEVVCSLPAVKKSFINRLLGMVE